MSGNRRALQIVLALLITIGAAALIVTCTTSSPKTRTSVVAKKPIVAPAETCAAIDPLPPAEPSRNVPTLAEAAQSAIDRRVKALAGELASMWTRNPEELVAVVDDAAKSDPRSPSVTLLLAIAHAETNGEILDVSEAGAVGLAQATPVAIRQEELDGKMFVTADYLTGSRAYIMKKPLGDADTIASMLLTKDDPKRRARAKRLLASAFELRREGVDELALLDRFASPRFAASVDRADEHNLTRLRELKKLLAHRDKRALRRYRDNVRGEYRSLKQTQVVTWKRYQDDLIAARDRALEEHFGRSAAVVKKEQPYEAGEYLASELDLRFSARQMAAFLVRHLERKSEEARRLSDSDDDDRIEEMTAALYNGGSHNVKRMLAGLIASLPETQHYMRKVPQTRRRLDATIARVEPLASR
ncbi:MAG: hypothetical protein QOI24_2140 [Acidobacteriota bacterium]|jgi:hypothetical protein|nr:hypothetical protein [Acidobacteriota bacterium]